MANIAPILRCPTAEPESRSAALVALDREAREAFSREMRAAGLSHEQFRSRLSDLLGMPISLRRVYSWTSPSRDTSNFPFVYVDFICQALGSDSLRRLALSPNQRELLDLGVRAAAILGEQARHQLLNSGGATSRNGGKRNGSRAVVVLANRRSEPQRRKARGSRA
jgi:hypothetical protein